MDFTTRCLVPVRARYQATTVGRHSHHLTASRLRVVAIIAWMGLVIWQTVAIYQALGVFAIAIIVSVVVVAVCAIPKRLQSHSGDKNDLAAARELAEQRGLEVTRLSVELERERAVVAAATGTAAEALRDSE
jgi:hypothetical protein